MSYSFSVKAATAKEALRAADKELANILQAQPIHEKDLGIATEQIYKLTCMLPEDDTRDVGISANGSVWVDEKGLRSISVNVTATRMDRTTAKA